MKKLIAALAVCVGTAAFANNAEEKVQQEQTQQHKTHSASEVINQQPGDAAREAQERANKGVDATEVGPEISKEAKKVGNEAKKAEKAVEDTFKSDKAFSMKGTIKDKTLEGVTIERQGLPAADLDIRDQTAVWLDGKKVKADALPEGAQVRAKFQLEGQDIVAVELRATSPKTNTNKELK